MGIRFEEQEHEVEKSSLIEAMIGAVQEGGQLAKDYFKRPETITHVKKPDGSIQTNADINTQAAIGIHLEHHYTEQPFSYFGEETAHKDIADNSEVVFIADPIDGTTNYLGQNINWGVTLSAFSADDTEYKHPIASVIFRPMSKELLWISNEEGFANRNKTHLIDKNNGTTTEHVAIATEDTPLDNSLDHKLISISLGRSDAQHYEGALNGALYNVEASLRDNGSTALTMGMVAGKGRDGMILLGEMNKWDVAAGIQLAKGSGCTIFEEVIEDKEGKDVPCLIIAKSEPISRKLEEAAEQALDPSTSLDPERTHSKKIKMAKNR